MGRVVLMIPSSGPSEARAGTHNHRPICSREVPEQLLSSNDRLWLWVPAFAGTTSGSFKSGSIRPEHELAVALEIRAGPHIELSVLSDEEQRALRHLLGAFQEQAGIARSHLVDEGLAFLVVAIAHVRLQLP